MTSATKKRLGCLGSGRLYQAVQQYLEREYEWLDLGLQDLAEQGETCSMILYCDDQWDARMQQEINRLCRRLGLPWLRAYCEFGVCIIGPYVDPRETGCVACVETRRRATMENGTEFDLLRHRLSEVSSPPSSFSCAAPRRPEQPWLTASHLEVLAQLVVGEVCACFTTPEALQTRLALLRLDLSTLDSQGHRFLPEPECPVCGNLCDDSAEAAIITLQPRPKLAPLTYRTRSLASKAGDMWETYVDGQTGLISAMGKHTDTSVATVSALIGINGGGKHAQMSATGRTFSHEQSQLAAIAEALERYGGQRPKAKRTMVYASYRELGEQALDPTTLGLHTAEQYALPGFRYVPYHPDLQCGWVWGYSFARQAPILIPEQVGYYGSFRLADGSSNPGFVYEISNGCALGSCLEEAIFYGILEVAERDAFLLTWYAQLALPRLDLHSATDPALGQMLSNLEHTSGYTIHVFNSTLDHAVPCSFVMAVDEQDRPGMPKALCGAGSHPNPEQAVMAALLELDVLVRRPHEWFTETREKALQMLADPMAVKEMEDHSLLYSLPEAFERLHFLYHAPSRQQTFQEAFSAFYRSTPSMDLSDDLRALVDYYLARSIDIVVVNQTTPEHTMQDFHCVKVIMPGMLPMTFGHQYRRHTGFERLYRLPAQLGYRDRPLTDADINSHPHPFP